MRIRTKTNLKTESSHFVTRTVFALPNQVLILILNSITLLQMLWLNYIYQMFQSVQLLLP